MLCNIGENHKSIDLPDVSKGIWRHRNGISVWHRYTAPAFSIPTLACSLSSSGAPTITLEKKKIFICGLQGDDLAQTVLQICPRKIRFTPRPMKLKYFGGCLTFFLDITLFLPIVRTVLRCFFCVFHFLLLLKCILEKMWLEMGSTSLTTKLKKDIKICYTHWGKHYYFGNKFRIFEFSRQKGWFYFTDLSQNLILFRKIQTFCSF